MTSYQARRPWLVALVSCALVAGALVQTQPIPPRVAGARVVVSVSVSNGTFRYAYQVVNSSTSTAPIWKFAIDVTLPESGRVLSWDGLALDALSAAIRDRPDAKRAVPVAMVSPLNWTGGLAYDGTVTWSAQTDYSRTARGATTVGFEILSPGPPGIRTFQVEPFTPIESVTVLPPSDEFGDVKRYVADLQNYSRAAGATGWTIGPTSLPAALTSATCVERLEGSLDQSETLGWVNDALWAHSLRVKIEKGCALFDSKSHPDTALFRALIQEVHAQLGKKLSPEAAALVEMNAEYLISQR
jgi:hypothetical protein